MRHRYPPLPPDGSEAALHPATTDSPINLFPRNADRALSIELIQPTVKFFPLRLRQRHSIWIRRKAVPELLKQLEPFIRAQRCDVNHAHMRAELCVIRADTS